MKRTACNISCTALFLGGLGALLRLWLFRAADARGLLPTSHPSIYLVWALTALFLVFLWKAVKNMPAALPYELISPATPFTGAAAVLSGLCVAGSAVSDALFHWSSLMALSLPLGVLAGGSMIAVGINRFRGQKPGVPHLELLTLYLLFQTVCQSRRWGGEPQALRYLFPLIASVLLMICSYHHTAFLIRKKSLHTYLRTSAAALFFSCLSLNDASGFFYLAMILWVLSGCLGDREAEPVSEETL